MAKIPYGIDPIERHIDDDGWVNLRTINEFLEDSERLPADLARWLGSAISWSKGNPDELLRHLGLKGRPGRPSHKHGKNAWLKWGARVCSLENGGAAVEAALAQAIAEYAAENDYEVTRPQLQKWRDKYRKGYQESQCH